MTTNYDDIIDIAYPFPSKYPKMSIEDRAAQFSPFAALTGHKDAIQDTVETTSFDTVFNTPFFED